MNLTGIEELLSRREGERRPIVGEWQVGHLPGKWFEAAELKGDKVETRACVFECV